MVITIPEEFQVRARSYARVAIRTPFTRRTWSEFLFMIVGAGIAAIGAAFALIMMAAGAFLAITFFGLALIGLAVLGSRGIGEWNRGMARTLLGEDIATPEPFTSRPGFFGWLQAALRDRAGWRAMAYSLLKVPLSIGAALIAFSVWWDAFICLISPFRYGDGTPNMIGVVRIFLNGPVFNSWGWFRPLAILVLGLVLVVIAPWPVRGVVYLDRLLMQTLLSPDATTVRMRSLEVARAQTVDESAATLRKIERDLHDGTQAQLVALAMRLGLAKEKLADPQATDLDTVRRLVDEAHRGAKEAIVELRDLARGIHPPALDIGLEGALSTLAARSTVPTDLSMSMSLRPTAAIEAIAYFCVAELLANVAQHANASRASISCTQHGAALRLVVRDDGTGGALPSTVGSSSSGLKGLVERVRTVDGRMDIVSPAGGPTVVTVDLPLHV